MFLAKSYFVFIEMSKFKIVACYEVTYVLKNDISMQVYLQFDFLIIYFNVRYNHAGSLACVHVYNWQFMNTTGRCS